MSAADLTLQGWDWLRAAAGLGVFLLPGLAAADRWLKGVPWRWLWAPVLSFTLLALAAILLDFVADVDVRPATTVTLALGLAGWIARPRLAAALPGRSREPRADGGAAKLAAAAARAAFPLLLVLPFLFVAHSMPHLEGPVPEGPMDVPQAFFERAKDAATGNDIPYPVHVDEHLHLAFMGAIDRTGEVQVDHPYTGEDQPAPAFTVAGLRSERGWQVAIVQLHQATDVPFPTLDHFLPALWAAYLGLALWLTLRPAPGAAAAAAFTAILPTTLRFLGVGFLVPSAFGLPWILAVIAVAHLGRGPGRLAALSVLITGAFFMHIVPGTIALAAGLLTALLRQAPWQERLGLAGALLLPLVWIGPAMAEDAQAAVTALNLLPFETQIFRSVGIVVLASAVAGSAWAWFRRTPDLVPHRVLTVLALGLLASIVWSIDTDHSNDATYGRLIPVLFLSLAGLAGLGVGVVGQAVGSFAGWLHASVRAAVPAAFVVGIVLAGLAHPVGQHMAEPYYRVFDDAGWDALTAFEASEAGPDDVFLSHPWRAPLYNALTGARPWAYLLPGGPPVNGEDYASYRSTEGADPAWLEERSIRFVVDPQRPAAPHQVLAPHVYVMNGTA